MSDYTANLAKKKDLLITQTVLMSFLLIYIVTLVALSALKYKVSGFTFKLLLGLCLCVTTVIIQVAIELPLVNNPDQAISFASKFFIGVVFYI